jgi:hypothetical protein
LNKYKSGGYSDQITVYLGNIANELAEANRLKRLELRYVHISIEGLEDQAKDENNTIVGLDENWRK